MKPFAMEVLSQLVPQEDLNRLMTDFYSFVYARQWENKYWEGYKKQFVCFFDDFG